MTTCWSQEKRDGSTQVEREAERNLRIHPKPLVAVPGAQIDHSSAKRMEEKPLLTAGYARWRAWFIGWDVMVAAMAGMMILFFLDVASLGVLGSAVMVVGIVAVVGLGHYLLWGRVFARGLMRERQRFQDQARRSETSGTQAPDEFSLGINDRERRELLQLLEHSLAAATDAGEGCEDGAAIRRELRDKIRMFGA